MMAVKPAYAPAADQPGLNVPFVFAGGFRGCVQALLFACALLASPALSRLHAGETNGVGTQFESLTVGTRRYEQVVVRSVTPRSITVTHSAGMASILLRELPPELQARFGYNPETERAADEKMAAAQKRSAELLAKQRKIREDHRAESAATTFERILQSFGQAAELRGEIDLRPQFRDLALGIKDQGRRPSCSVFAVVSALEYQNAVVSGTAEKLSEEYLVWATRRTTQRAAHVPTADTVREDAENPAKDDEDEGFSLPEVVAALRAYGIPPQSSMPNTFGTKMEDIPEPPANVVTEARKHRKVYIHVIPGHDTATRINNLVQALNTGTPVAVGLRWPHYRTLRAGYLSQQKPILDYAHAVTVVGYKCESGRIEDAVFLFKNSWGMSWGEGGYGRVTYEYLSKYLLDGVLLEVQRADEKS